MKTKRNLSGIYIKSFNESTEKYENVCFEDLEEIYQNDFLKTKDEVWLRSLCLSLAKTLNEVGKQFDIISK